MCRKGLRFCSSIAIGIGEWRVLYILPSRGYGIISNVWLTKFITILEPFAFSDGDLVNEIINATPCVVGKGGVYSIVAVILYAVMIVMACRLPKDDPYGLCCKKSRRGSTKESLSGVEFGLVGGETNGSESDNTALSGPESERPNWVSEEKKREVEENEII